MAKRRKNYKTFIIVGAGTAGMHCALELLKLGVPGENITMFEKGKPMGKRNCPKLTVGKCVNCVNCSITSGVGGSGTFSDAKCSLNPNVGGDFPDLIGYNEVQKLINYVDDVHLSFGAKAEIGGLDNNKDVQDIRRKAIKANLKLVDCPVRHLGTEKSRELYFKFQEYLLKNNVNIISNTDVIDLIVVEDNFKRCIGVVTDKDEAFYADNIIASVGRSGSEWLSQMCNKYGIAHIPGTMDIGVRVECRNEVMQIINDNLYEAKLIGYPKPFENKVRTFCQNPGGFVAQENYDDGLAVVNGHAYKDKKSNNTNFAILVSHNFTTPFNEPIKYAKMVGELTNMLGDGHILVQRFGDIINGKRTWQEELDRSNLKPTLEDAIAGDITAAMPYRTMISIINFIKQLDEVVPGIASDETLLYSPELKFYSNKIEMDKNLKTSIDGLYCLGDGSGWTRGIMMSASMGAYCARKIVENLKI